jgi:hypothetical protein
LPPSLAALRDDHINLALRRPARVLDVGDLLDPEDTGIVGTTNKITWVSDVEGDSGRPGLDRGLESLRIQGAHGVVDGERPVGQVPQPRPLITKFVDPAQRRAEAT